MGTAAANVTIDFNSIVNNFSGTNITIPQNQIADYISYDLTDSDNGNVTSYFNSDTNEWEFDFTNPGKMAFTAKENTASSVNSFEWKEFTQSGSQDLSNRVLSNNNHTVTYDVSDASGNHLADNVDMVVQFTKNNTTYTANWDPTVRVGVDPS